MSANDYHFVSHWRVQGDPGEVFDIISDSRELIRWWPAAYLDVLEIQPGDEGGVGKVVRVATRGWLPFTLNWHFSVSEAERPRRIAIKAWGDFSGTGVWTFDQDGPWVKASYDWRVRVSKPPIKYLSPLLRPVFEFNHRWAMARGEESLRLEVDRRHTRDEDLHLLPPPPGPTKLPARQIWLGVGLAAFLLVLRPRRRPKG